jgi:HemY protein
MRRLIALLIIVSLSVGFAMLAKDDPGYVLFVWRNTTMETSLSLMFLFGVLVFGLMYTLIRLIIWFWTLPRDVKIIRDRRRFVKIQKHRQAGLFAFAEGDWKTAEKNLVKSASLTSRPLVDYLNAARAAQKLQAYERRDRYLAMADGNIDGADVAVGLTQAELQYAHGQYEEALASLIRVRNIDPKHPYALRLLAQVYRAIKAWGELVDLLPELKKRKAMEPHELEEVTHLSCHEVMNLALNSGSEKRLRETWERLPKAEKQIPGFIVDYARAMIARGQSDEVEPLIRHAIRQSWDDGLVHVYGLCEASDTHQQQNRAEAWLEDHREDAVLLLTLARISLRNRLWGKARSYLEASISIEPRGESYRELGALLDQLDEKEKAAECYRKGISLMLDKLECSTFDVSDEEFEGGRLPEQATEGTSN